MLHRFVMGLVVDSLDRVGERRVGFRSGGQVFDMDVKFLRLFCVLGFEK